MQLRDLLRISMRQVWRQRRRNIGVIMAIALGTAGFILVITMSEDVKKNLNQDLELLGGATRIKVLFQTHWENTKLFRSQWFRDKTVQAIRDIPQVEAASLLISKPGWGQSTIGDEVYRFQLVGVDEYFWTVNSFQPDKGRFFGAQEVAERKTVCVLGEEMALQIFGRKNPSGEIIPIDRNLYRVIGTLGGLGIGDRTKWVIIPLTTIKDRISGDPTPRILYVRCKHWDDVEFMSKELPRVVKANQDAEGLKVEVAWKRLEHVKRVSWWFQFFIYIALVATLVLGGFGILNIQMVAVRARTREIGLKKAMGAEDRDILSQFLTESLCLSLVSALIGVIIGRIGVMLSAYIIDSRPQEDLFLICVAAGLVFSIVLGVGAGLYPSIRASRMEVVTALRFE